jgi:hypothetical protein
LPRKGYTDWKEIPVGELIPAMFCTMVGKSSTREELRSLWAKLHSQENRLFDYEILSLEQVLLQRAKDLDIPLKGGK